MNFIETMSGVEILTRDLADMPNGAAYVTHFGERSINPREYPVSGDMLAKVRAEQTEVAQ